MYYIEKYLEWQNRPLRTHYGANPDNLFFATALSHILFFCAITMLAFGVIFTTVEANIIATSAKFVFIPPIFGPVVAFMVAHQKLRAGKYNSARDIFVFTTMAAIVFSVAFTGGFLKSEASQFLVVIPIMVYLLYGMKAGTMIALWVPVIIFGQELTAFYFGVSLPNFSSTANPAANAIGVNGTMYLLVLAMVASFEHQRSTLKKRIEREQQKMRALADTDPLTGLLNHRAFHEVLELAEREANDTGQHLALIYLDLNRFKQINDKHGHSTGDYVLLTVANRLLGMFRNTETVARLGGDEFAILIRSQTHIKAMGNIISRLQEKTSKPIKYQGATFAVGASIGFAIYPHDAQCAKTLLEAADIQMYSNKSENRDSARTHDMQTEPVNRLAS